MSHTATVSGVLPRYIYNYSDALHVTTRATVAFQGTCRCGWQGKWRESRVKACDDYELHKRKHRDGND